MVLARPGRALAALAAAAAAAAAPLAPLTTDDVAAMAAAISGALRLSPAYGVQCAPCALGDAIGGAVRLAFHDAAGGGGRGGAGGANGCVDFVGTRASFGLQEDVATLAAAHAPFAARISVADWWVLAGATALASATAPAPGVANGTSPLPGLLTSRSPPPLTLPFRYGRADEAACVGVDGALLPPATLSWAGSRARFRRFGLTDAELVAFFGAHAVGRASAANSGTADGGWTVTQSSFAPTYLRALLNDTWTVAGPGGGGVNATPAIVWLHDGGGGAGGATTIMLKSDIEVGVTPSAPCAVFSAVAANANCTLNGAGLAVTAALAANETLFFELFASAWTKVTEFNYNDSELVLPAPPATPSPAPAPAPASPPLAAIVGAAVGAVVVVAAPAACFVAARWRGARRGGGEAAPLLQRP